MLKAQYGELLPKVMVLSTDETGQLIPGGCFAHYNGDGRPLYHGTLASRFSPRGGLEGAKAICEGRGEALLIIDDWDNLESVLNQYFEQYHAKINNPH